MSSYPKVLNIRSSLTVTENGITKPKLPTNTLLGYGELAINYAAGYETISLKNSNNEIISFSNDNTLLSYIDNNQIYKRGSSGKSIVAIDSSNTDATADYSHAEGLGVTAQNQVEQAQGQYNISNKANDTFGDAGNTLFSVGNGTSSTNKNNAFEIRQNGDVYFSSLSSTKTLKEMFDSSINLDDYALKTDIKTYTAGDNIAISDTNVISSSTDLIDISNNMFAVADGSDNIGFFVSSDGIDAFKLTDHFKSLIDISVNSEVTYEEYTSLLNRVIALEKKDLASVSLIEAYELKSAKFYNVSASANTSYTSVAEAATNYSDSTWLDVSIPHDWSIRNNFNSASAAGYACGYLDGGDSWYRITLPITSDMSDKKIILYFDGISMESTIYVNGTEIGKNYYSFNPFEFDVTSAINFTGTNVLAIFVRNNLPSTRWYAGSGIYRKCAMLLCQTSKYNISDIVVTSENLATQYNGDVTTHIAFKGVNATTLDASLTFTAIIYDKDNNIVNSNSISSTITQSSTSSLSMDITVNKPHLWSIYDGYRYKCVVSVSDDTNMYNSVPVKFGYRFYSFTTTGFSLNGVSMKHKGVCLHHDYGCIGTEDNDSIIKHRMDMLVEMGCNGIRTSHNPYSETFLNEAADHGLMVIDEIFDGWWQKTATHDFGGNYFDAQWQTVVDYTVKRDINNPAVILWSIGNELFASGGGSSATVDAAIAKGTEIINEIRSLDTTRKITFGEDLTTTVSTTSKPGAIMNLVDVIGLNYANSTSEEATSYNAFNKPILGTECCSFFATRGEYTTKTEASYSGSSTTQFPSWDNAKSGWGDYGYNGLKLNTESTSPTYISGGYFWTGFDYIGEPTPVNSYPSKSSYFGIIDLANFPKDAYYLFQSRWSSTPMVHIVPMNWDYTAGSSQQVWLYSNCNSVELFLNGTSLGSKTTTDIGTKFQYAYTVTYAQGTLVANGYDSNSNLVAQDVIYTSTGTAVTTSLSSDKVSVNYMSDDLVFITCDIVDKNFVRCPDATNSITFTCTGGSILGTDNGNSRNVHNMRSSTCEAFHGKVLAVVKHDCTSGNLVVTATGTDLQTQTITIKKSDISAIDKHSKNFIVATNPIIYSYS